MKIFEFDWGDETDWWCDHDLKSAKEHYISFTGCNDLDGCKVSEVTEEECKKAVIIDINDYDPDREDDDELYFGGYKIIQSFSDYLKTATVPDMVATTAF